MKTNNGPKRHRPGSRFYGDVSGLVFRLRQLMRARGYTQKQLGDLVGLSSTTVSYVFSGAVRNPSTATLRKLANVLNEGDGDALLDEYRTDPGEYRVPGISTGRWASPELHLLQQILDELRLLRTESTTNQLPICNESVVRSNQS